MENSVLVIANKNTGEVVTTRTITDKDGNSREVGIVMLQQKSIAGLSTIGRMSVRTAFQTLEEDVIEFLGDSLKDKQPFPVAGKLCINETLEPYIRKDGTPQEPKINPSTDEVITFHGKPVYRNTFFTEDVHQADVFLKESATAEVGAEAPE